MEKRLFLAVALSLLVVFLFQSFFGTKTPAGQAVPGSTVNSVGDKGPANLPEVVKSDTQTAEKPDFKEVSYAVKAGKFKFNVLNNGASISTIHLSDYNYDFPVKAVANIKAFDGKPFILGSQSANSFSLQFKDIDWNVEKQVNADEYKLNITYQITNTSASIRSLDLNVTPFIVDLSRLDEKTLKSEWTLFEYAMKNDKMVDRKEQVNNFTDKWKSDDNRNTEWIAFRDQYFVTIVQPESSFKGFSTLPLSLKELDFTGNHDPLTIQPGQTIKYSFTVFCGPQKLDVLKEASNGFEKVLVFSKWGWLDAIAKVIYWLLGAIHKIFPIWGLCIIVVSLIVYGAMYPLTLKSMTSMKKMQALQPKMAQLKEKYKSNPEKLNKEIVELYRVNNVNPVSGCLPMILQMPIFVGLYQVLWRSFYFRGESFLWIKDLSQPDRLFKLPFSIPFVGEHFNILPILMIFIMLAQQIITLKNMTGGDPEQLQQQKIMAVFFPIFLGIIFYNFASGLNLYFVVFYTLSALSQWNISRTTKTAA